MERNVQVTSKFSHIDKVYPYLGFDYYCEIRAYNCKPRAVIDVDQQPHYVRVALPLAKALMAAAQANMYSVKAIAIGVQSTPEVVAKVINEAIDSLGVAVHALSMPNDDDMANVLLDEADEEFIVGIRYWKKQILEYVTFPPEGVNEEKVEWIRQRKHMLTLSLAALSTEHSVFPSPSMESLNSFSDPDAIDNFETWLSECMTAYTDVPYQDNKLWNSVMDIVDEVMKPEDREMIFLPFSERRRFLLRCCCVIFFDKKVDLLLTMQFGYGMPRDTDSD